MLIVRFEQDGLELWLGLGERCEIPGYIDGLE